MSLDKFKNNLPDVGIALEPGTPLWQVVPTRGEDGRPLVDFMMWIPGLRGRPKHVISTTMNKLQWILEQYHEVVFVNLNLKINVLWISVKSRPGIILDLASSIQRLVPEALLIAQKPE